MVPVLALAEAPVLVEAEVLAEAPVEVEAAGLEGLDFLLLFGWDLLCLALLVLLLLLEDAGGALQAFNQPVIHGMQYHGLL